MGLLFTHDTVTSPPVSEVSKSGPGVTCQRRFGRSLSKRAVEPIETEVNITVRIGIWCRSSRSTAPAMFDVCKPGLLLFCAVTVHDFPGYLFMSALKFIPYFADISL